MSETRKARPNANAELLARLRAAARQEQFLEVVSADEARARFEKHLDLSPLAAESVPLAAALTRVLAHDVVRVDGTLLATGTETRVWGRYENGPGTPLKGQPIGDDLKELFKAR